MQKNKKKTIDTENVTVIHTTEASLVRYTFNIMVHLLFQIINILQNLY